MANVIINDTNLTNIANAIREKNGTTDTYKPSEMAEAILAIEAGGGGGYEPTDEELRYELGRFTTQGETNAWVVREYGNRVVFEYNGFHQNGNMSSFIDYPYEVFDANPTIGIKTTGFGFGRLFESARVKKITGSFKLEGERGDNSIYFHGMESMFKSCSYLEEINDNFINPNDIPKFRLYPNSGAQYHSYKEGFAGCSNLKRIPDFYFKLMCRTNNDGEFKINSPTYVYNNLFNCCYSLKEIKDLPVAIGFAYSTTNNITSNMFSQAFRLCSNATKLTFATNNGEPKVAPWTSQVIDLRSSGYDGFGLFGTYSGPSSIITTMKNNIKLDSNGLPTARYEDQFDWHSLVPECAKYGLRQAIETINSLPDTSAAGGNNTIHFTGKQGKFTDYLLGYTDDLTVDTSISNLTEEEIAVAAAKGWTVSLS